MLQPFSVWYTYFITMNRYHAFFEWYFNSQSTYSRIPTI